jgi:tetratricopeptide (TPR) repeat protein
MKKLKSVSTNTKDQELQQRKEDFEHSLAWAREMGKLTGPEVVFPQLLRLSQHYLDVEDFVSARTLMDEYFEINRSSDHKFDGVQLRFREAHRTTTIGLQYFECNRLDEAMQKFEAAWEILNLCEAILPGTSEYSMKSSLLLLLSEIHGLHGRNEQGLALITECVELKKYKKHDFVGEDWMFSLANAYSHLAWFQYSCQLKSAARLSAQEAVRMFREVSIRGGHYTAVRVVVSTVLALVMESELSSAETSAAVEGIDSLEPCSEIRPFDRMIFSAIQSRHGLKLHPDIVSYRPRMPRRSWTGLSSRDAGERRITYTPEI